jgi:hypothetical protein
VYTNVSIPSDNQPSVLRTVGKSCGVQAQYLRVLMP